MTKYKTSNYFVEEEKSDEYSTMIEKDGEHYLKVMIYKQGARIVYRAVVSFWDLNKICEHTKVRPQEANENILNLSEIKNRYLDVKHGEEIATYIKENIDNFILPSVTTVIGETLPILYEMGEKEYIHADINQILKENGGCITAYLKIDKNMKFKISDGNHRTYAIQQLINRKEVSGNIGGLYIGIDFYLETDMEKEKEIFVMLNTTKPIDKSVLALLRVKDLASYSVKSLLGINSNCNYAVDKFYAKSPRYLGVDLVSDIPKENNVVSFNILRNMVILMANGILSSEKKFNEKYENNKLEYFKFLERVSEFLNYIFTNCEPFKEMNRKDMDVKKLRQEYVSLTGAGLYVISMIGHSAIKYDTMNIERVAEAICKLDWKREVEVEEAGKKEHIANPLFAGGILTEEKKISNNRTGLSATVREVKKILKLTDDEVEKQMRLNLDSI